MEQVLSYSPDTRIFIRRFIENPADAFYPPTRGLYGWVDSNNISYNSWESDSKEKYRSSDSSVFNRFKSGDLLFEKGDFKPQYEPYLVEILKGIISANTTKNIFGTPGNARVSLRIPLLENGINDNILFVYKGREVLDPNTLKSYSSQADNVKSNFSIPNMKTRIKSLFKRELSYVSPKTGKDLKTFAIPGTKFQETILGPMDKIQIFFHAKNRITYRFPTDYCSDFTGLLDIVSIEYSEGFVNIHLEATDVLKWLKITRINVDPALSAEWNPEQTPATELTTILSKMRTGEEILKTLILGGGSRIKWQEDKPFNIYDAVGVESSLINPGINQDNPHETVPFLKVTKSLPGGQDPISSLLTFTKVAFVLDEHSGQGTVFLTKKFSHLKEVKINSVSSFPPQSVDNISNQFAENSDYFLKERADEWILEFADSMKGGENNYLYITYTLVIDSISSFKNLSFGASANFLPALIPTITFDKQEDKKDSPPIVTFLPDEFVYTKVPQLGTFNWFTWGSFDKKAIETKINGNAGINVRSYSLVESPGNLYTVKEKIVDIPILRSLFYNSFVIRRDFTFMGRDLLDRTNPKDIPEGKYTLKTFETTNGKVNFVYYFNEKDISNNQPFYVVIPDVKKIPFTPIGKRGIDNKTSFFDWAHAISPNPDDLDTNISIDGIKQPLMGTIYYVQPEVYSVNFFKLADKDTVAYAIIDPDNPLTKTAQQVTIPKGDPLPEIGSFGEIKTEKTINAVSEFKLALNSSYTTISNGDGKKIVRQFTGEPASQNLTGTIEKNKSDNGQVLISQPGPSLKYILETDLDKHLWLPWTKAYPNLVDFNPYLQQIKSSFQIWQSMYHDRLDVCLEIVKATEFEFFADGYGCLHYKPPTYTLTPGFDFRTNFVFEPWYFIEDIDIISNTFSTSDKEIKTYMSLTGQYQFVGTLGNIMQTMTSWVQNPVLVNRYGVRHEEKQIPALGGDQSLESRILYAQALLNRKNSLVKSETITLNGTPEFELGRTVCLIGSNTLLRKLIAENTTSQMSITESADQVIVSGARFKIQSQILKLLPVFYISKIDQSYSYQSKSFTTTLSLTHGRRLGEIYGDGSVGFGITDEDKDISQNILKTQGVPTFLDALNLKAKTSREKTLQDQDILDAKRKREGEIQVSAAVGVSQSSNKTGAPTSIPFVPPAKSLITKALNFLFSHPAPKSVHVLTQEEEALESLKNFPAAVAKAKGE